MKIAIEAQRIFRRNKHGMDFVALESIRCLQELDHENEYFILVAPGEDRCLEATDNFHIVELRCPSYPLWEQVALPRALRRIRPDLLHCTSNTAPLHCAGTRLVVTLHDIIFLERQAGRNSSLYQQMGRIYRRLVVPRILRRCSRIVTVSAFERDRIRTALGLREEAVVAIHNGYNPRFRVLDKAACRVVTARYLAEGGYLLFLGNTDPKKNTAGTLRAYAAYLRLSATPRPLLIADLQGEEVEALLERLDLERIRPMLRIVGYIPHADLPAIYNGAFAFLYTSLRESFGIPILEAMACGTPVITSDTSAIPEIAGRGAMLVDPTNPDEIAARLVALESDEDIRRGQIAYGLHRVGSFSWKRTAEQLLSLYRKIGTKPQG